MGASAGTGMGPDAAVTGSGTAAAAPANLGGSDGKQLQGNLRPAGAVTGDINCSASHASCSGGLGSAAAVAAGLEETPTHATSSERLVARSAVFGSPGSPTLLGSPQRRIGCTTAAPGRALQGSGLAGAGGDQWHLSQHCGSAAHLPALTGSSGGLDDMAAATAVSGGFPPSRSCSSTQLAATVAAGQQQLPARQRRSSSGAATSSLLQLDMLSMPPGAEPPSVGIAAGYTSIADAGCGFEGLGSGVAAHHALAGSSGCLSGLACMQPSAATVTAVDGTDVLLQPLVQPEVMMMVAPRPLPSMDQVLALLAAPMPAGTTRRPAEAYLEVSTFTSRGPQAISLHKVMCQLAVLGLQCKSAEAGTSPAGAAVAEHAAAAAMAADLQLLLQHLGRNIRRAVDVGRVVMFLRLDGSTAAVDPGLIIAATSCSKAEATRAVRGLVDQLALVYD